MAIDMIEQNESARFDENDSEQASLNGLENSFFSSSADYSSNDNGESNGTNGQSTNKQTPSLEYLQQLLKDKTQLVAFPNIFAHVNKLVDEEISRVRNALFQYKSEFAKEALKLPEPVGEIMTREEKVFVPVREHPDFNFVGRILGPRGMTAKQFEQETGCKIMVRGKGSMRDKKKEELNRGKPNWEHLNEDLHVLIHCEDTANRIESKIARAIDEVKKLLTPSLEGDDELKKKQLMELALINGTYRNGNSTPNSSTSSSTVSKNSSMLHSNPLSQCMKTNGLANLTGAPLILPTPSMSGRTSLSNSSTLPCLTNHIPGANTIPLSTLSALQQPNLNPASNPYLSSLIGLHNTNVPVDYQLLLGQVQQSLDANTQLQFIQQQQQQLALAAMIQAQSATGVGGLIGDYSTTLNTYGIPAFDPSNSGPISSQKKYQQQNRDHPYSTRKEALKKEMH